MKPSGPALFFLEWFFIINSIYFTGMEPLRFPVSFCLSFGKLHLSISSKSFNLLAQSFHNIPGDSLWQDLGCNYQLFEESVFSQCPSITAWLRLPAAEFWPENYRSAGPVFSAFQIWLFPPCVNKTVGQSAHKELQKALLWVLQPGVSTEPQAAQVFSSQTPADKWLSTWSHMHQHLVTAFCSL